MAYRSSQTGVGVGAACLLALGCSGHPDEGTLVKAAPGVPNLPGGSSGRTDQRAVPLSGGTLTIAGESTAVAADPERNRIFVADLGSGQVQTIELEEGSEPGRSVVDAAGRVHVALRRGGSIVSIDPKSASILSERQVCGAPRGIAYDNASDQLHVACDTGELVSLPAQGGGATRTLQLGRDLRDVIALGDKLVVTRFRSAEVITVNAQGSIERTSQPRSFIGGTAAGVFQAGVAWRAVARPDGSVVMAHQRANSNTISIGAAGYYQASSPCAGGIVHGTVTVIDPETSVSGPPSVALPLMVGTSDVAVSPDGAEVAVVSVGNAWATEPQGSSSSSTTPVLRTRFSKANLAVLPVDRLSSVDSCALPGETELSGEPVAVAYTPSGQVVVQSREPAQLQVVGGKSIALSTDSVADTGTALFHVNSGFGVACASCHPEGRDDGRTWEFAGIGPRRTQSFAGGLMATAPFHWSGDVESLHDLMHDVFVSRMGGAQPNSMQVEHFADYLDRIPAPSAPVLEGGAVARGKTIFHSETAACASCHSGPLLTNNLSYDVGTGNRFQVPSLIGVDARAPFMHDGCAQTLEGRFGSCGGGDAHGVTSSLSGEELSDLTAYLRSL